MEAVMLVFLLVLLDCLDLHASHDGLTLAVQGPPERAMQLKWLSMRLPRSIAVLELEGGNAH